MTARADQVGGSGALVEMSGFVPKNATWNEDIYFTQDGSAIDISGLDWRLTFRESGCDTSAVLTLSTDDGTLTIETDNDGTDSVLNINVSPAALSALDGDYIADLASRSDDTSEVTLWAHGVVTFRGNPVSWS